MKTVTIEIGSGLLSNRYLVGRYGSNTISSIMGQEWVIPEFTLKPIPSLLNMANSIDNEAVKPEPGTAAESRPKKVIQLPRYASYDPHRAPTLAPGQESHAAASLH
jgi:hypothetical protein